MRTSPTYWSSVAALFCVAFAGGPAFSQTVARYVSKDSTPLIAFPDADTAVLAFVDWKPTGEVTISVGQKTRRLVVLGRTLAVESKSSIRVQGPNGIAEVIIAVEALKVFPGANLTLTAARFPGRDGVPLFARSGLVSGSAYAAPVASQSGVSYSACGEIASLLTTDLSKGPVSVDIAPGLKPATTGQALIQQALASVKALYPNMWDDTPVPDSFWSGPYSSWKQYWDNRHYDLDGSVDRLKYGLEQALKRASLAEIPFAASGSLRRLTLAECTQAFGAPVGDWIRAWETSVLPSVYIAAKQSMDQQLWEEALSYYSYLSRYRPIMDTGIGISSEGSAAIDGAISDRARFGSIFKSPIPTETQDSHFSESGTMVNDLVSLDKAPAPSYLTAKFAGLDGARQKGSVQVDPAGTVTLTVIGQLIIDPAVAVAVSQKECLTANGSNALESIDVAIDSASWQEGTASAWRAGSDLSLSLTMPRSRAALVLHQMRSLTGVPVNLRIKRSAQLRDSYVDLPLTIRLRSQVGMLPLRLVGDQIVNIGSENIFVSHAVVRATSGKLRIQKANGSCELAGKASKLLSSCFGQISEPSEVAQFVFETNREDDSTESAYFDFVQNDLILGVGIQCELPLVHAATGRVFSSALMTVTPINTVNQQRLPPKIVDLRSCGAAGKRDLQWVKPNDTNSWAFVVEGLVSFDSSQFSLTQTYVGPSFAVTADMLPGFN